MHIDIPLARRRSLPLTPLIDVIFILLLFFMLSSTFLRFAEVEITGGTAADTASVDAPDVLIRLEGAEWNVNGVQGGVEAALTELRRLQEQGAERAVLLVRGETSSQEMVSAVEQIRAETDISLSVAK
ncbi:ExbD/TolR family protein [Chelativorans sp. YIM 93263]|uniref:ExbD/TolR family protein n=1 Tax=Chelativorans sp. YIM 93263 TaxID=2906648 RepID=UPI0023790EA9|nr:biopolymer transporter ExbD [Chelativorans sp. YIM 93263]